MQRRDYSPEDPIAHGARRFALWWDMRAVIPGDFPPAHCH